MDERVLRRFAQEPLAGWAGSLGWEGVADLRVALCFASQFAPPPTKAPRLPPITAQVQWPIVEAQYPGVAFIVIVISMGDVTCSGMSVP
jgi:hypothetical protein